jgi:hypothetical protein
MIESRALTKTMYSTLKSLASYVHGDNGSIEMQLYSRWDRRPSPFMVPADDLDLPGPTLSESQ